MNIINMNNAYAALVNKDEKICCVQDILDIMATAQYYYDCVGLIVYKECLGESFFELKTGYAGEVLQKISNYQMKIAIIGDFSQYKSNSLHDFIYECNKGNQVFFKDTVEDGLNAIVN